MEDIKHLLERQDKPFFFRMFRTDVDKFVYVMLISNELLISITGDFGQPHRGENVERWALISIIDGQKQLVNEIKDLNNKIGIWELDHLDEVRFMGDVMGYIHPLFRQKFHELLQNILKNGERKTRKVLSI